ncbi:MAG: hypothetical protein KAH56_07405 [Candidatus Krumholzibacteria bacterium]|nr:hypothetical protein [Candidatus Krumholzibacteria bacterium]
MRIWSPEALKIMNQAQEKAFDLEHAELDPLHLLWAFLQETILPGEKDAWPGWDPTLAIRRTELDLAGLPRAWKTVVASPNAPLRELILRAADLAATTNNHNAHGRIGPHELVLALVGDRGPSGDILRNFEMKSAAMAG